MGPGGSSKDLLAQLSQLSPRQLVPAGIAAFCTLMSLWYFFSSPSSYGVGSPYGSALSSHGGGFGGGEFLQAKLRESERIWRASVKRRLAWFKKMGGMAQVTFAGDGRYMLWDMFIPSYNCPHSVERIGNLGDGGKWICGAETLGPRGKDAVIYSIGVDHESSFEQEMLDRFPGVQIYGYDLSVDEWGPQVAPVEAYKSRAHFFRYGLGDVTTPDSKPPMYTLKALMEKNGHDFIDIFKIDIETAEWSVIPNIIEDFMISDGELPFGQMQIELHAKVGGDVMTIPAFAEWWQLLENAGLRAFHHELNMPTVRFAGMYYSEYSFINTQSRKNPLLGNAPDAKLEYKKE